MKGYEMLKQSLFIQVCNPAMRDVIGWKSESDGTFVIRDQARLAQLWGRFKKKPDMDYSKFS